MGTEVDFNYGRYLASREWALLKEQVRERSKGWCERCTVGNYEETHHLTYERIGRELLEDLLAVCRPCHRFLSAKCSDDPKVNIRIFAVNIAIDVSKSGYKGLGGYIQTRDGVRWLGISRVLKDDPETDQEPT